MAQPRTAHIRPAVVDDLDQIMDLVWEVAAEGVWIGAEVPFDRQVWRERYASLVEGAQSTVFVADASLTGGPGVIGEITLSLASYGVTDISMMLGREWRGLGLGRALLDAGIAWAKEAGAHKLWLEVWRHNTAAISLYQRAGFTEEGRKLRHYRRRGGTLWDAALMGLHFQPDGPGRRSA